MELHVWISEASGDASDALCDAIHVPRAFDSRREQPHQAVLTEVHVHLAVASITSSPKPPTYLTGTVELC